MLRHPLGERSGEITHSARVGDGSMAAGQFQLGRQRDRAGGLDFHGTSAAAQAGVLPRLLERIEILVEQADSASQHRAAPRREPVTTWHGVDSDVDEQRTGSADDVGTDPSVRQLHEMRQRVQFTDDDLGGLAG